MNQDVALRRSMLFAFMLPGLMAGMMHAPAESIVQGVYAKYTGLSLAALGTAVMMTRIFDALTYPLIGYLSDLTARRSGTRKPWLAAGTAVSVVGLWFLYRPPQQVSIVYFTAWFMINYLGWKMLEIPYLAWSLELSGDYRQRARIAVWRGFGLLVGPVIFYLVPYAAKALGMVQGTAIDLPLLSVETLVILALVPALVSFALYRVPGGEIAPAPSASRESWRSLWRSFAGNAPLLRLLGAMVPVTFLVWMGVGALYLYVDVYMGLGKYLAIITLLTVPATVLAAPLLGGLCLRFERHRVLALAFAAAALLFVIEGFVPRGPASLVPVVVLWTLIIFCVTGGIQVVMPQLLGDVTDYGRLQLGEDRTGLYSAAVLFTVKSLGGVAAGLALVIAGWFGFSATAAEQTVAGVIGIKLVAVWLPALGLVLGGLMLWSFPIDRARQGEIRAALKLREEQTRQAGPAADGPKLAANA